MDISGALSGLPSVALAALPFGFIGLLALLRFAQGADRPRALVDGYLAWAIVSDAATEILGATHRIAFLPVLVVWLAADGWALYRLWELRERVSGFFRIQRSLPFWVVAAFAAVTLFIALTTVPNNFDSQTYHLPRIEHWIQDGSLAFYPTSIARQNEMGPVAEILLLQTRILGGSDWLYPLVQWASMLCSVAAVFRITRQLGGNAAQCWIAAVFLVTLPIGVLESTSTQNDYVVAALLAGFVTLGLEAIERPQAPLGLVLAAVAALALSGLTKPVGYLVGAGFALWFAVGLSRRVSFGTWAARAAGAVLVLALIVAPFAGRAIAGRDAAQSELAANVLNGSFGVRQTLDVLVRDVVSNFATGIPPLDAITQCVGHSVSSGLGFGGDRADTVVPGQPPDEPVIGLYIFHEDNGPNLIHTILVIGALLVTAARWRAPQAGRGALYAGAWLVGIVGFAALFRWGLWQVRYQVPGFALAAPLVATAWPPRWSDARKTAALCLFLGLTSLPVLLLNQSRQLVPLARDWPFPLRRERVSYLTTSAIERRFVNQPQLLAPYRDAVDAIVRARAARIGLVLGGDSWEYPLWWMLRERGDHRARIEHVMLPDDRRFPLGPFTPDVIFWSRAEAAPATLTVDGEEFIRVGPAATVAVFARSGLATRPLPQALSQAGSQVLSESGSTQTMRLATAPGSID